MPIELVGKDKVRRIRPATPVEELRADAARLVAGFKELWPFEPHFFEVEPGVHMHFVDEGPRSASPILCVHGNPTWSFYWRSLLGKLSGAHRVIAVDHVGMGLSDKPQDWPYRLENHIAALERFVVENDLKNITLVAHDWGGPIGLGVAMRHPGRFRRFVLQNTAAFTDAPAPAALVAAKLPVLNGLLVGVGGLFNQTFVRTSAKSGLTAEERRAYLAPYSTYGRRVAVQAFVKDIPLGPMHPSHGLLNVIDASLARLATLPVLVQWGMHDFVFTRETLALWQQRLPEAQIHRLPHAGHLVLEDAEGECLERISSFLAATGAVVA